MSSQPIMLRFTSNPQNVAKIEPFVGNIVKRYRINPDLHGNILISLTEAVTNAIVHGNNGDENKSVAIELNKSSDKITIKVTDEGSGFDFNNLPDPTSPINIAKIGGRGVFLMRQLSDSIHFYNNGSTVVMQFNL